MSKRVFLIVMDSFGIGEAPDAADFGDSGANTLKSVVSSRDFHAPTLAKLGLFNIDGASFMEKAEKPLASFARLRELSRGKDTTIGHWEIAGVISPMPLPTYPEGFPEDFIKAFEAKVKRKTLCNKPYSGTEVIRDYGERHMKTGELIVYTSADSVFQIAANEAVVPLEELYSICRAARELLDETGNAVGRVIARPFVGDTKETFTRTTNRHDFSLLPPKKTMLDYISEAGKEVIAVGKINDIFAKRGVTNALATKGNADGMRVTDLVEDKAFSGLCFVNLVDFDMLYGHRNDVDGYARAVSEFDEDLSDFMKEMKKEDILIITADHGCDPGFTKTTDHTREYVPLLVYGENIISGVNLGTRDGFCDIAASICDYLDIKTEDLDGNSFIKYILK